MKVKSQRNLTINLIRCDDLLNKRHQQKDNAVAHRTRNALKNVESTSKATSVVKRKRTTSPEDDHPTETTSTKKKRKLQTCLKEILPNAVGMLMEDGTYILCYILYYLDADDFKSLKCVNKIWNDKIGTKLKSMTQSAFDRKVLDAQPWYRTARMKYAETKINETIFEFDDPASRELRDLNSHIPVGLNADDKDIFCLYRLGVMNQTYALKVFDRETQIQKHCVDEAGHHFAFNEDVLIVNTKDNSISAFDRPSYSQLPISNGPNHDGGAPSLVNGLALINNELYVGYTSGQIDVFEVTSKPQLGIQHIKMNLNVVGNANENKYVHNMQFHENNVLAKVSYNFQRFGFEVWSQKDDTVKLSLINDKFSSLTTSVTSYHYPYLAISPAQRGQSFSLKGSNKLHVWNVDTGQEVSVVNTKMPIRYIAFDSEVLITLNDGFKLPTLKNHDSRALRKFYKAISSFPNAHLEIFAMNDILDNNVSKDQCLLPIRMVPFTQQKLSCGMELEIRKYDIIIRHPTEYKMSSIRW